MKNAFYLENIRRKIRLTAGRDTSIHETPLGYRCAAVVIPLIEVRNSINVLFTRRTASVRDHQNQVSFPGGGCEKADDSFLDTALRELYEEIGVQVTPEAVLGALAPRKTITGYYIIPYIALIATEARIRINPAEVKRIIIVPLEWLADEKNFVIKPYRRPGTTIHDVIFYSEYEGEVIWGITAEILQDFINEIKK